MNDELPENRRRLSGEVSGVKDQYYNSANKIPLPIQFGMLVPASEDPVPAADEECGDYYCNEQGNDQLDGGAGVDAVDGGTFC